MAARQKFQQMCPACHTMNEIAVHVKATAMTPTIAKMECERCDCRFILQIAKSKGLDAGQVMVTPKLTYISPDGKRFIRAQEILREKKAKEAAEKLKAEDPLHSKTNGTNPGPPIIDEMSGISPELAKKMIDATEKIKAMGAPPGMTADDLIGEVPMR